VDRSSVTLERLREAFEVYNRVAGKSPATIKFYNEKLTLLQRFLGAPLYWCQYCRLQFYDYRPKRRAKPTPA
jgi:hypothetical protein